MTDAGIGDSLGQTIHSGKGVQSLALNGTGAVLCRYFIAAR